MPEPESPVLGRPVHDPTVLRAISHPTRNRILSELAAHGPMRAADLARELALPANSASFHLRQLAKYGLVEEDTAAARDRRDRVWRPVGDTGLSINLRDLRDQPGGAAAASVYLRSQASWAHHVVERAHADTRGETGIVSTSEHAIRLTREEAKQLQEELIGLLNAWSERGRAAPDGPDTDRTTYLAHLMLLPYPDLPAGADPGGVDVIKEGG